MLCASCKPLREAQCKHLHSYNANIETRNPTISNQWENYSHMTTVTKNEFRLINSISILVTISSHSRHGRHVTPVFPVYIVSTPRGTPLTPQILNREPKDIQPQAVLCLYTYTCMNIYMSTCNMYMRHTSGRWDSDVQQLQSSRQKRKQVDVKKCIHICIRVHIYVCRHTYPYIYMSLSYLIKPRISWKKNRVFLEYIHLSYKE